MILTFYGQFIYNSEGIAKGVELLVRGESEFSTPVTPAEIFENFNSEHFLSLDMQIISHLNMLSQTLKSIEGLEYVFVNFSDVILRELIFFESKSIPSASICGISKRLSPLKLVIEVSENSKIKPEYMSLIVNTLQQESILVAQDDFDESRLGFLETVNWDFIKIDVDSDKKLINKILSLKREKPFSLVFERSGDLAFNKDHYHQGFVLHKPECLSRIVNKNTNCHPTPLVVATL